MLKTKPKSTVREYQRLPEGERYELMEGELIMCPSPTSFHQRLILRLARFLSDYAMERGLGEIFISPLDVYLDEYNVIQPDLLFISHARREQVKEEGIEGPPDMVMEVLSPSNRTQDIWVKKELYQKFRVPEYWIVDPDRKQIEVWVLEADAYCLLAVFEELDALETPAFPGIQLSLASLFA